MIGSLRQGISDLAELKIAMSLSLFSITGWVSMESYEYLHARDTSERRDKREKELYIK